MSITQVLIGGLVVGVPILYVASKSFSSLEVPAEEPKQKKEKLSRSEKKGKKKAAAISEKELEKEAAKEAAAERKREKERAKKAAKREQKKLAEAAAATEAASAADAEPVVTEESPKKKKKKKKAKKAKVEEEETPIVAPASADDWTEVKSSKGGKKVVVEAEDKDDKIHLEVDVDPSHFKTIIGKGGSTLRAIQEATNAEIDIPKVGGMRSSIILTGHEAGVAKAREAILQLADKGYCSIMDGDMTDDGVEVKGRDRSSVIGPGGAYIRAIQESTGTKIQMPDRESTSNFVKVLGPSDGVKIAITAINELISTGISSITHAGHAIQKMSVPRNMMMYIIGEKGSKIRQLQELTGAKINTSQNNGNLVEVTITGPPEAITEAQKHIAALMVVPAPVALGPEWSMQATASLTEVW